MAQLRRVEGVTTVIDHLRISNGGPAVGDGDLRAAVCERLPDFVVDESRIDRYIAHIVNGMKYLPVTFTPGSRLSAGGDRSGR